MQDRNLAKAEMAEDDRAMPLMSHVRELRRRLMYVFLGMAACTAGLLPVMRPLFDLASKPLMDALPQGAQLLSVGVVAPVLAPLKVVLFAAFFLSLPFTVYQIWRFIAPGLFRSEKRKVLPLVVSTLAMFAAGVAYCYFVVFGFLFKFIAGFSPDSISFSPDIDSYISFVLHLFLAFGLTFEVPIAVLLLSASGAVSVAALKRFRRYLIVLAFGAAAVITPPDVASQLLLALPIILLYELGILLAPLFSRKPRAEAAAAEAR
jgi:sec-independent protein translocase protein TatC